MSLIWLLEQDELLVDYRAGYEQSASDCSAKAQAKSVPICKVMALASLVQHKQHIIHKQKRQKIRQKRQSHILYIHIIDMYVYETVFIQVNLYGPYLLSMLL